MCFSSVPVRWGTATPRQREQNRSSGLVFGRVSKIQYGTTSARVPKSDPPPPTPARIRLSTAHWLCRVAAWVAAAAVCEWRGTPLKGRRQRDGERGGKGGGRSSGSVSEQVSTNDRPLQAALRAGSGWRRGGGGQRAGVCFRFLPLHRGRCVKCMRCLGECRMGPLRGGNALAVSPRSCYRSSFFHFGMHPSPPMGKETALRSFTPSEQTPDSGKHSKKRTEKEDQVMLKRSNDAIR